MRGAGVHEGTAGYGLGFPGSDSNRDAERTGFPGASLRGV